MEGVLVVYIGIVITEMARVQDPYSADMARRYLCVCAKSRGHAHTIHTTLGIIERESIALVQDERVSRARQRAPS